MKKNVWIDTDPGLDDTLAIIWAVQQEQVLNWKIKGISTITGNLPLSQVNGNAFAILNHLGRTDIPIYSGVSKPLLQPERNASYVHGTALGPFDVAPIENMGGKKSIEGLADCLKSLPDDELLTLVTLGPLTNIAFFIRLYPELTKKIEHIVIMGGGDNNGNVTHYAEFNIYVDPEAAKIVFDCGIPITMSGLDISDTHAYIYPSEFEKYLPLAKNPWTAKILDYMANAAYRDDADLLPLYDPTAMLAAAYPDLFIGYQSPVTVELLGLARGMTLIPKKPTFEHPIPENATTKVLVSCDRQVFLTKLFEGL